MRVAKGWVEDVGLPGSCRQGRRIRRKEGFYLALEGKRVTSHVRSQVEWPLADSQTVPGLAGERLETQLS